MPFSARDAAVYGLQNCPPYDTFWFRNVNTAVTRVLGENHALHDIVVTVLDQTIWRPLYMLYSFTVFGLLSGKAWPLIKKNIQQDLIRTIVDGWKVWPAVVFITEHYFPERFGQLARDLFSFFWDLLISMRVSIEN